MALLFESIRMLLAGERVSPTEWRTREGYYIVRRELPIRIELIQGRLTRDDMQGVFDRTDFEKEPERNTRGGGG